MKFEKIIKNKYLYYAACVLAAINLLGYVSQGSMECIIVFGIATYAAHYLTKNRAIDIFAGLFVSNVLFGCGRIKEGFHDKAENANMSIEDAKKECDKTIAAAQAAYDQAEKEKEEASGDAAEDAIKAAKKAKTALEEAEQHCKEAEAALKAAKKK